MLELEQETLLYRLFHEDKVRLFDGESVRFACSCSRQSQRSEPKVSPVRHSLCTRTRVGISGRISPRTRAMWSTWSISFLKTMARKSPNIEGSLASAARVTWLSLRMRYLIRSAIERTHSPCRAE